MGSTLEDFVEISYRVRGRSLPFNHGYKIYASIKAEQGQLPESVHLSPISQLIRMEKDYLITDRSLFRVRCPIPKIKTWAGLSGKSYRVGGSSIRLVSPRIMIPQGASQLYSPFVSFHLKQTTENVELHFLQSVHRAIERLGIYAEASVRKVPHILELKGQKIVGFSVDLWGLTEHDSLIVLRNGLGGRRHMGCGWFYGVRENG